MTDGARLESWQLAAVSYQLAVIPNYLLQTANRTLQTPRCKLPAANCKLIRPSSLIRELRALPVHHSYHAVDFLLDRLPDLLVVRVA